MTMPIVTNTRLIELRDTGRKCQEAVDAGNATKVAEDYAELFEIIQDHIVGNDEDGITKTFTSLSLLIGK